MCWYIIFQPKIIFEKISGKMFSNIDGSNDLMKVFPNYYDKKCEVLK